MAASQHATIPCVKCGSMFESRNPNILTTCPDCRIVNPEQPCTTATMEDARITTGLRHAALVSKSSGRIDLARRELAARELASRHLLPFIARFEPTYHAGWVHQLIARKLEAFLQAVRDKKSPRLMIQMPPRSGKSLMASTYFPAWALGRYPELEIIATSYAASLAMSFSRKVRGVLRDERFTAVFGTKLHAEEQNAEGWRTTQGGVYLPAGVGGPITGRGAHLLLIDDPLRNSADAESETIRNSIREWYQTTAYTRLAPGGGVLLIQTRWHLDDLSGWLEEQMRLGLGDTFDVLRFPLVATEDEEYRRKGDVLHPERYDLEAAERIRQAVGPRTWAALYQQNPLADGGQYFARDMFKEYAPPAPRKLAVYAAFDLAIGQKERNDYTVGVVVGVDANDDIWVLDVVRGRWDSHRIVEEILEVHKVWQPDMIGVERGHIQMAIGPYLDKRIAEERLYTINVVPLSVGRRDKQSRARAIQGRMRQGKVRFPHNAGWFDAVLTEMLAFPDGRHDDIVDAFAHIGGMLHEISPPAYSLSGKDKGSWRHKLRQFVSGVGGRERTAMSA